MRWIVGDVHGCVREFDDLLRRIRFDTARDELWCAGDLVNTGPDSVGVLRLWRDVDGKTVIGNHDVYALLVRSGAIARRKDRLDALFASDDRDVLFSRLRAGAAMTAFEREGERPVRLVHAGVHPEWTDLDAIATRLASQPHDDDWLRSDELSFMTRVRSCDPTGERTRFTGKPEDVPAPYKPWDVFYRGEELIVHGHWAMRGYYCGERTLGLDSGCVYGGKLTAWCLEEDRVESVPCRVGRGYYV
jgi:bis(5'-nucleosyl)-tetraphosphatase (symmetrical)